MKQYRFDHQLKQADIAKKLGISQQVYSLIENGTQKPTIDFLLHYKKVTGIDLMGGSRTPNNRIPVKEQRKTIAEPLKQAHLDRLDEVMNRVTSFGTNVLMYHLLAEYELNTYIESRTRHRVSLDSLSVGTRGFIS